MKRMGWNFKAWYRNSRGVPFHKYFTTGREMDAFTAKAEKAGSVLEEYAALAGREA